MCVCVCVGVCKYGWMCVCAYPGVVAKRGVAQGEALHLQNVDGVIELDEVTTLLL